MNVSRSSDSDDPGESTPRRLIARKRDGGELSSRDIESFVRSFLAGETADYQMSAFLMAVYFQGMSGDETAALTRAMVDSGIRLDLSSVPGIKVDKHSTGGVGDKVSIPLAPLVAACGVFVPMISGRGLGHTGGTLDKLEAIPGFRTRLPADEFVRILSEVGYVMGGQSADLAPADRRMYALRDVTATVESIPLIVSSILSKKVAEGADGLIMDVKFGRGAFMPDIDQAATLGRELDRVGTLLGLKLRVFLTDMDKPLGRKIGNALEIAESIDLLTGGGPPDLKEITLALGGAMLVLAGRASDEAEGRKLIEGAIADGSGLERFRRLITAQGGDPSVLEDPSRLPAAPVRIELTALEDGWVVDVDPRMIGEAIIDLGGGRRRAEDAIDPAVGVDLAVTRGDAIRSGQLMATIHAADRGGRVQFVEESVRRAIGVGAKPPPPRPLIINR
ncbi:MAG: thymidine phosphorylase [Candidatus Eisenbacteria bacterium]|nr:thymidine phosphorylase [Candidatus Eisenbacteria bacterium]